VTVTESQAPTAEPARRRRSLRWALMLVLVVIAVVVAVVLSAGFGRDPTVVQSVLLDRPAPPLAGATLGGGRFDIGDHRGEVVLVNVWASWCGPCRDEYPVLEAADRQLGPRGLAVVGINTQDSETAAQAFLDELGGQNFPSVLDPDGRIAVEWGTFGVPETFVVDRDGRLRAKMVGPVTRQWINGNVVPLLDQP
jgi:cytochrome c biogenesis protein CcmG/thiol:disulfide interchange protein DsbE